MAQPTRDDTALRISLPDIARLAQVQRPVVSMWRTRSARTDLPFPGPIANDQGQEYFDVEEVVGWIEATGRGKSGTVRDDAPTFASLEGGSARGDEVVFLGLTALLCLSAVSGRPLSQRSAAELLDFADDADPDDLLLYRELAALDDRIVPLGHYADRLSDAAYSPVAAFEALMSQRFRLHVPGQAKSALTPEARRLVAELVMALGAVAPGAAPTYVDPTVGGSDLLIELAGRTDESVSLTAMTSPGSDTASRLARRRFLVNDVHQIPLVPDGFGGFELPLGALILAHYPCPGTPGMTDADILQALDASVLQMLDDGYGVVVGPASALTDTTQAAEQRTRILRTDRVRAIVRLPHGLVTTRPRQRMALWILGPPASTATGAAAVFEPPERRTLVADLDQVMLDDGVIDSLVTDLIAGLRDRSTGKHDPRFTRFALNRVLAGSRGDLVAPEPMRTSTRRRSGAEIVVRVRQLGESLSATMEPLAAPSLSVSEAPPSGFRSPSTLGAAVSAGLAQIFPGHRIQTADIGRENVGCTRIIGVDELTGVVAPGVRTISRLVFAAGYPAGRYTEPGDVVFCSAPRPAALVDEDGGSVVAYPARIARVGARAPMLPHVLAADIHAAPATAKSFRAWTIRQMPDDQRADLDRALADLRNYRSGLASRLDDLDTMTALLTQGITKGSIRIAAANIEKGK